MKITNQIQSQAGILGISANTNMGGYKIDPKAVLSFTLAFIIIVKIAGRILAVY